MKKMLFLYVLLTTIVFPYCVHGLEELITAIKNTDTQTVKSILSHNPDLANQPYIEQTKKTLTLTEAFLSIAENLDKDDLTAIFYALNTGSEEMLRTILSFKPNINIQLSRSKNTPLHHAVELWAKDNQPTLVSILLAHGANPHLSNAWGQTPLFIAAGQTSENTLAIIQQLLAAHADEKHKDYQGKVAADYAWRQDVILFLKHRIIREQYPLFEALTHNNFTNITNIITNNPQELIKNKNYESPLAYAIRMNRDEKTIVFLIQKIKELFPDKSNDIFSYIVQIHMNKIVQHQQWDVLENLLQNTAPTALPISTDAQGNTILHTILEDNNNENAKTLIPHLKSLLNTQNNRGETPLHTAILHKQPFDILQLCIEQGADPRIKTNKKLDAPQLIVEHTSLITCKKFFTTYPDLINPKTPATTPLDKALEKDFIEKAAYLYNHGGRYTIKSVRLTPEAQAIISKPRQDNQQYEALAKDLACLIF